MCCLLSQLEPDYVSHPFGTAQFLTPICWFYRLLVYIGFRDSVFFDVSVIDLLASCFLLFHSEMLLLFFAFGVWTCT